MNLRLGDGSLTPSVVAQLLRQLSRSAGAPADHPLFLLRIVQSAIHASNLPQSPQAREIAFFQVITDVITEGLAKQRRLFRLEMPQDHWTFDDYQAAICADLAKGNADLMAYSLLYHTCVRVDLDFSPRLYADTIAVTERTYNRYFAYAARRVTHALIEKEQALRQQERRRWLMLRLPTGASRQLIGRDELLDSYAMQALGRGGRHLLVTGSGGIGKTAFIEALAARWIDADLVYEVIWLDNPATVGEVQAALVSAFVPEGVHSTPNEIIAHTPGACVIVCDGIEEILQSQPEALEGLLQENGAAVFVMASRVFFPLHMVAGHVALAPLDSARTETLFRAAVSSNGSDGSDLVELDFDTLYINTGGVPEMILAAASRLHVETWEEICRDLDTRNFGPVFASLPAEAQIAWCALAFSPPAEDDESMVWDSCFTDEAIRCLRRWYLVEPSFHSDSMLLQNAPRRYIQNHAAHDPQIGEIVETLLVMVDEVAASEPSRGLRVIEGLLLQNWLTISERRKRLWFQRGAAAGLDAGHTPVWRSLLASYAETRNDPGLMMSLARCSRRLGYLDEAIEVVEHALNVCHAAQNAAGYGDALLEKAVVLRLRGEYHEALAVLREVRGIARRYSLEISERAAIEQARIALDRQRSDEAFYYLRDCADTPEVCLLKCEAYLLLGFLEEGRALAEQVIEQSQDAIGRRAAASTLLGRCWYESEEYQLAHQWFLSSLALSEQAGDRLGAARAQGNIGAALIHLREWGRARRVLLGAARELTVLGDPLGAAAAQHNLHVLDIELAR